MGQYFHGVFGTEAPCHWRCEKLPAGHPLRCHVKIASPEAKQRKQSQAPYTRPGKHTREAMENHHFIAKIIYLTMANFPQLCEKLPEASWDLNPYGAMVLELLSHPGLQASTEFDESDIQTF